MIKSCRECGQSVAARAKTCPHCGVRKPTATKAEAGLDAFAGATAKLAFLIMALVVIVVIIIIGIAVGCASPPPAQIPAPTPAELREQEQNERIVKAACAEWWDGLRELTDEQAKVCTDTGYGR